ncbi:hypothetical protein BH11PSE11_BH11PSE11_24190 [soil metagenome]
MIMDLPVNILLVDDEPNNLLLLEAVLGGLGQNLIRAGSGAEALEQIAANEFAVIILDFHMPPMDGLEVARIIRQGSRAVATPIIFVTAADSHEFPLENAYSLGAIDYLTKPFNPIVLRAKVAFFVELAQKTQALAASERARHKAALSAKDERIRLILENAKGYAFIVADLAGNITEWEGGSRAITGWTAEEAIGQSLDLIFTPQDRAAGKPEAEMAVARMHGLSEDKRWHLNKYGGRFFADGVMVTLKDASDHLHGYAKIFRDATAERLSQEEVLAGEAKLIESRALFSLLLESSVEGIYGMNQDGACTFLNAAGAALLGYRPDELVGRPINDIIRHSRAEGSTYSGGDCRIGQAARTGVALRVDDEVFRRKDGSAVPVSYSVSPIIVDGAPAGAVVTFSDSSERLRNEAERERLLREIHAANDRKTEFLAILAHELRNPLAPIRNGLSVLSLRNDIPAAVEKIRDMMDRQVTHMVHLIDDLLDIARISGGKVDLKKERIELGKIVSSAIETSLPLIEAAQHTLVVDLPDDALVLDADPVRLAQVFANLLNNAAKYTNGGGRIEISARRSGTEVVIAVTDNGMGIPAESLGSVFDMFNQVGRNLARAQGGLGIGLSLVRWLVDMHGGVVTAESSVGEGSAFTVRLPLAHAGVKTVEPDKAADESGRDTARGLRVLVVDDNEDAAEMLSTVLTMNGHVSQIAHDGYQALEAVREFRPEVAFLDIGMPGMNGYETAIALRKIPGLEHVILVALTGWGSENDRAKSQAAGFNHHLTKPAELAAVTRLLSEIAEALDPIATKRVAQA